MVVTAVAAVPLAPRPIPSQHFTPVNAAVGMAAAAAATPAAGAAASAASGHNGAVVGPPAKRAAPTPLKAPNVKLEQGWVEVLPLSAGEYMRKAVER